jgi:hypothetical protein
VFAFTKRAAADTTESFTPYTGQLVMCDVVAIAPTALVALGIGAPVAVDIVTGVATSGEGTHLASGVRPLFGVLPYVAVGSAAGYATCAPVVHAAHGRPVAMLGSFGLRVGLPLVAGAITYGVDRATTQPGDHFMNGWQAALTGIVLVPSAFAAALALDYSLLSRPDRSTPAAARAGTLAPTFRPTVGGGVGGLIGIF